MKGKRPWNYIDGKSALRIYLIDEWKIIAKECYKRDNYTCQDCGKRGGLIHAHHINPYAISKNNDLDNLITLCGSCHARLHNNTRLRELNGRFKNSTLNQVQGVIIQNG